MEWLPSRQTVTVAVVTVQVLTASVVYIRLGTYNSRHKRRFEQAREVLGKKRASNLFELPAFRTPGPECPNPFENTTWMISSYERIKLSIAAVTVFPFRLFGVLGTFVMTYLAAKFFLTLGMQPSAKKSVTAGCRSILFFFGFHWITIRGVRSPGAGAVVSNHCTFLDGLVWCAVAAPRIFAEESNFKHFMMRAFAQALEVVCFDRSGTESRRLAREKMASAAADAAAGGAAPILVFPEGTTKNLKTVITFKDGAFAPGVPVQPAVLRYRFHHCDPTWVFAGPGLLMLIFRLLCQVKNCLEVEFLPLCEPTEEEKSAPNKFARRVQTQIATAMGVPMTEHAVEDLQLEVAALKAKMPAEVGVVGFSALKDFFSVGTSEIKQQMVVFREMDKNGTGRINFEEFADGFKRAFHAPSEAQTELLRNFFQQLTGGQPTLDFRKFLIGLALVGGEAAREAEVDAEFKNRIYARLAFAAFAAGSDSSIARREFEDLWSWLHPADKNTAEDARKAFEAIAGQGAQELPFETFVAHSEKHPDFEKSLRQAFFNRISSVLAPQ